MFQISAPVDSLPEIDDPLVRVIGGIYRVGGDNVMCGLFCLGKCAILEIITIIIWM